MSSIQAPSEAAQLAVLDDPLEWERFTRWVEQANGLRLADSGFAVSGMTCAACASQIEAALQQAPGIVAAKVNAAGHSLQVRWNPDRTSPSAIVQVVRGAGYDAVPDVASSARQLRAKEKRVALWRLFVASFCAMQVMMFATPSYVAGPGDIAPDLAQLLNWGSWLLSLPVMLFSAGPFLSAAWRQLKSRRIGMDVPVALGLLVTFVASTGATFDPHGVFGEEVYFDSLTMFVSFLLGGRFLELSARHRAAASLEGTLAAMPETAIRVLSDGSQEVVSVQRIVKGDRILVPLGAAFPADGVIDSGRTQADESILTGESHPIPKQEHDEVVGGSVNLGAPVRMQVLRAGAQTHLQSIIALMKEAQAQRPAMARWADAWATPFLWTVLILAIGAGIAWAFIEPARAVWVTVAVLIVTCPCALSLAAPAAVVAATGALARRGVLIQRLDALEGLTRVNRLFIDKTGTLTESLPALQDARMAPGEARVQAEWHAGQLARASIHPLAKALAQALAESPAFDNVQVPLRALQERAGAGVEGIDPQGCRWRLGSWDWVDGQPKRPVWASSSTGLEVWLGRDGTAVAQWVLDEQIRPDARATLQALDRAGWSLTLLSGDQPERVARVAAQLGLKDVRAAATPETKLALIREAQAQGQRVAMVGDGVNDAPVLAQADISFAMGQGALVSRVHADGVLVSNRLMDLVQARSMAEKTMKVVSQNILWAAAYNLTCIPLALMGYLPPWAAGLGMALSSLVVIGNSLRLSTMPATLSH